MISLGEKFPEFKKTAVVSIEPGKEFKEVTSEDHKNENKWMVMFWYPKDFTFVCPTEIAQFNQNFEKFLKEIHCCLVLLQILNLFTWPGETTTTI